MPRQPRLEYAGAVYHVMNRGDRREAIFRDDEDRRGFLETPGQACEKTGWQVHAYCLMTNHVLRKETVMTLEWIGQRLAMGSRHTAANCLKGRGT